MKTKEEARQYLISQSNFSTWELMKLQDKLSTIARKFHLVREFKENGLI